MHFCLLALTFDFKLGFTIEMLREKWTAKVDL